MRIPVDYCQFIGMKGSNNIKSTFNRRGALAKPLIASILTAFILIVGSAKAMGAPYAPSHRNSGATGSLITPTNAPAPGSTTVVLLGIGLVGLAGADVGRRWKRK